MKSNSKSIWSRLLIANLVLLPAMMSILGYALYSSYQIAQVQSIQSQLTLTAYGLISDAEWIEGSLVMPELAAEPSLNQASSHTTAYIMASQSSVLWQSRSTLAKGLGILPAIPKTAGSAQFGGPYSLQLAFKTIWNDSDTLTFVVERQADDLLTEMSAYRLSLVSWLGGVALALIFVQFAILKWGLRPIQDLNSALIKIERGREAFLNDGFSQELAPIVDSVNSLIRSQREQRDRYKQSLGNLAHSLKTPLAILRSEETTAGEKEEQIERMDNWIRYHLNRSSGGGIVLGDQRVEVNKTVERIVGAMRKVYLDKQLDIEIEISKQAYFIGDPDDLLEICGNLVDNACKYGDKRAKISAELNDGFLSITVENDGAPIPAEQIDLIMQRGGRMDENIPGQGIGLSVVADIVAAYKGQVSFSCSDLGGALVKVTMMQDQIS